MTIPNWKQNCRGDVITDTQKFKDAEPNRCGRHAASVTPPSSQARIPRSPETKRVFIRSHIQMGTRCESEPARDSLPVLFPLKRIALLYIYFFALGISLQYQLQMVLLYYQRNGININCRLSFIQFNRCIFTVPTSFQKLR